MSDVNSPDNDNIRLQQERDLGHKLDHDDAGKKKPANDKVQAPDPKANDPEQR